MVGYVGEKALIVTGRIWLSRRSRFQVDVEAVGWVVKKKKENRVFVVLLLETLHTLAD